MTNEQKLSALIQRVFGELGGRAEVDELADAVINAMPPVERGRVLRDYVKSKASTTLRAKGTNGLAQAQVINGSYVQQALMEVEEYRFVVRAHAKLAGSHRRIARRYVNQCLDAHGVDISDELAVAS